MIGITDHELLMRMRAGDTGALGAIYMRYSAAVREFAFRFIRNNDDVADIAHNVFCRLWDERMVVSAVHSLRNYLFSMTRNAILNELRHRKVVTEWEQDNKINEVENFDDVENIVSTSDLVEMIKIHIERMPELRRHIFVMSRYDKLSHAEIATRLNVSQKTVEYHIGVALKELRNICFYSSSSSATRLRQNKGRMNDNIDAPSQKRHTGKKS